MSGSRFSQRHDTWPSFEEAEVTTKLLFQLIFSDACIQPEHQCSLGLFIQATRFELLGFSEVPVERSWLRNAFTRASVEHFKPYARGECSLLIAPSPGKSSVGTQDKQVSSTDMPGPSAAVKSPRRLWTRMRCGEERRKLVLRLGVTWPSGINSFRDS